MDTPAATATEMEIDLRALFSTLLRKLPYIIVFVAIVAGATYYGLSRVKPVYTSQTTILIQVGESNLTQTTQVNPEQTATTLDEQAITSQVQLIRSRDLARSVAAKLDLASKPEFNPALRGTSLVDKLLARIGLRAEADRLGRGPGARGLLQEAVGLCGRQVAGDRHRLRLDRSRSLPPTAANAIAEGYIALQREAKRTSTADAAKYLSAQIGELRTKVKDAEAKVENFRSKNDLFASGSIANTTLPQQQLGDLSTELAKVRSEMADARAKADQIRAAPQGGRDAERSRRAQFAADPAAGRAGGGAALAGGAAFGDAGAAAPAHEGTEGAGRRPRPADRGRIAQDRRRARCRGGARPGAREGTERRAVAAEGRDRPGQRCRRRTGGAGARGRRPARPARRLSQALPRGAGARAGEPAAGRCPGHLRGRRAQRSELPEDRADDRRRGGGGPDPGDRLRAAARTGERPADAARHLRRRGAGGARRHAGRRPSALGRRPQRAPDDAGGADAGARSGRPGGGIAGHDRRRDHRRRRQARAGDAGRRVGRERTAAGGGGAGARAGACRHAHRGGRFPRRQRRRRVDGRGRRTCPASPTCSTARPPSPRSSSATGARACISFRRDARR